MTSDAHQIDRDFIASITRQVLQQLQTGARGGASETGVVSSADRVITQAMIEALPAGTRRLRFAGHAVITPAARDQAKQQGVELKRGLGAAASEQGPPVDPGQPSGDGVIYDFDDPGHSDRGRGTALANQLRRRGLTPAVVTGAFHEALAAPLSHSAGVAVVLADLPAVAVWQASRHAQARPAALDRIDGIASLQAAMDPNVWVLDLSRLSMPLAVAIAERCLRNPPNPEFAKGGSGP